MIISSAYRAAFAEVFKVLSKEYAEKLIELLKSTSFDIIQFEGLYMAPYLSVVRKHSNAMVSMRSHNVEYKIWEKHAKLTKSILKKQYLINQYENIETKFILLANL